MSYNLEHIFSMIGAIFSTASFLPQAVKTIRSKKTKDISLFMYILIILGSLSWGLFGIVINNYSIIICNILILFASSIILKIKISNYRIDKLDDR